MMSSVLVALICVCSCNGRRFLKKEMLIFLLCVSVLVVLKKVELIIRLCVMLFDYLIGVLKKKWSSMEL